MYCCNNKILPSAFALYSVYNEVTDGTTVHPGQPTGLFLGSSVSFKK